MTLLNVILGICTVALIIGITIAIQDAGRPGPAHSLRERA